MVIIVFGCIIVSFALSSLKQRHDIESWGVLAGTAFNNLAGTITGRHGIIQPKLHYQKRKKKRRRGSSRAEDATDEQAHQQVRLRYHGWGLGKTLIAGEWWP